MVRVWLRRVRWSATASTLAAVVALFGATAVASSMVADGQPSVPSPAASLASTTSDEPTPTPTTSVTRRRPLAPATTTSTTAAPTTAPAETTTEAAEAATALVAVDIGPDAVSFGTTTADPSAPCEAVARWRVPRAHPDANVVVSEDGQRLEERDPSSDEVLGVLATWDAAAGAPAGDGIVQSESTGCAPDDAPEDAPPSTVAG